jgi:hypothetical protein
MRAMFYLHPFEVNNYEPDPNNVRILIRTIGRLKDFPSGCKNLGAGKS